MLLISMLLLSATGCCDFCHSILAAASPFLPGVERVVMAPDAAAPAAAAAAAAAAVAAVAAAAAAAAAASDNA